MFFVFSGFDLSFMNFKSETSSIQEKIGNCSQLPQHPRPCLLALHSFLADKKHWSAVPESFGAEDSSCTDIYVCIQARLIMDITLR